MANFAFWKISWATHLAYLLDYYYERKEWKNHFENIQKGVGATSDGIWERVSRRPIEDHEMGAVPNETEIWQSVSEMITDKRDSIATLRTPGARQILAVGAARGAWGLCVVPLLLCP